MPRIIRKKGVIDMCFWRRIRKSWTKTWKEGINWDLVTEQEEVKTNIRQMREKISFQSENEDKTMTSRGNILGMSKCMTGEAETMSEGGRWRQKQSRTVKKRRVKLFKERHTDITYDTTFFCLKEQRKREYKSWERLTPSLLRHPCFGICHGMSIRIVSFFKKTWREEMIVLCSRSISLQHRKQREIYRRIVSGVKDETS